MAITVQKIHLIQFGVLTKSNLSHLGHLYDQTFSNSAVNNIPQSGGLAVSATTPSTQSYLCWHGFKSVPFHTLTCLSMLSLWKGQFPQSNLILLVLVSMTRFGSQILPRRSTAEMELDGFYPEENRRTDQSKRDGDISNGNGAAAL